MKKTLRFLDPSKNKVASTLEVQTHPEDVIGVNPHILAIMRARLIGETLNDLYSYDERLTSNLAIEREKEKLKNVFNDRNAVYKGFSSLAAIKMTKGKLRDREIDRTLLSIYASHTASGQAVDEVDLFAHLISGCELIGKKQRLQGLINLTETLTPIARELAGETLDQYLAEDFGWFKISKDLLETNLKIKKQYQSGELFQALDQILAILYRGD